MNINLYELADIDSLPISFKVRVTPESHISMTTEVYVRGRK